MGKIIDGSWSIVLMLLSSACLRSRPHPAYGWKVSKDLVAI